MQRILIGIGNPDPEHEATHHNAGRLFVEGLARRWGVKFERAGGARGGKHFEYAKHAGPGGRWTIVRTTVFMNESGVAAREAIDFWGMEPAEVVIAHDDFDLALGSYKYATGGGSAGHHGIESVIQHLDSNAFGRLRIGIRAAEEPVAASARPRKKAGDFVLKPFSKKDKEILYGVFGEIIEKVIENDTPFSSATIS